MSNFQDRTLDCADCNGTFVFTSGEQAFYSERGFSDPKRCPSCRAARKAARSGSSQSSYSSGGSDNWSRRERQPRQMFDVICADCGKPTQVPFEPRGDRPVYCKDCFQDRRYR